LRLKQIPGLRNFLNLPTSPLRCLFAVDPGRLFAVAGPTLYEVYKDTSVFPLGYSVIGNVGNGTNPAIIVANGTQLAIASAGKAYITGGGPPIPIIDSAGQPVNAATMAFMDQYFIAGIQGKKLIQISNLAPAGDIWDAGDVSAKEAYADNIQRVWVDQPGGELLWLFGEDTIEVWQDTGGLFPFTRAQGAVWSIGCDSAWSVAGISGLKFWLWRGVVWMSGAQLSPPTRISDYGVELAIKGNGSIEFPGYSYYDQHNCEGFCYISGGHLFYVLSFPEAGVTWVHDTATQSWAKRLIWQNNQWGRYRPRIYANQWGMDLAGDYNSGQIYVMDPSVNTDAGGVPLRRERIAPYITDQMNNVRYNRLTLDMDTGTGLAVPQGQPGWSPQIGMRYSHNRGKTWSNWRSQKLGQLGQDDTRVFWTQLGASYIGPTVNVAVTDPVEANINGAYLYAGPGTFPRT
jgi:hypothetical protein